MDEYEGTQRKTQVPSELEKQLCNIIENARIKTVFQPVVSLRDGSILGYEALSRGPADTPLQNPDALFGIARQCGKLWDLEQLCRTRALETAFQQDSNVKLFLNVDPHIIHDEKFKQGFTKEYLRSYNINSEDIIFEITEKNAVEDVEGFKKAIDNYKGQSYKIAIDDAGAGYSGLNMISDIHPHYIKLDMNLVRSIDGDSFKKSLVKCFCEFCRTSNVFLIAEGIETVDELYTLIDIGVHYGQGYFLQRPCETIGTVDSLAIAHINKHNSQKNHLYNSVHQLFIGNLSCDNETAPPHRLTQDIYNTFLEQPNLSGITIVNNGTVEGIITKTHINLMMSGQYGYSLHARREVRHIMDKDALIVDFATPIDVVSTLAMSRPADSLYDFIVVTKDGQYHGVVTIKTLLEKTMEIEVNNAIHLNPLTGLPGNTLIQLRMEQCISFRRAFTILYLDIDNFKAYNDVYGFENGDKVLIFVSKLLKDEVPGSVFIGHIGGDDFVCILTDYEYEEVCGNIVKSFDEGIIRFYSDKDLENGYILTKNRRGVPEQFPIMTISIAGITNRQKEYADIYELAEAAGSQKKKCKQCWTSCAYVD